MIKVFNILTFSMLSIIFLCLDYVFEQTYDYMKSGKDILFLKTCSLRSYVMQLLLCSYNLVGPSYEESKENPMHA